MTNRTHEEIADARKWLQDVADWHGTVPDARQHAIVLLDATDGRQDIVLAEASKEPKAPITPGALGVGIAILDDNRHVACVFNTYPDKDDVVIRVGYTQREVDHMIAALTQLREKLPD